MQKRVAPPAFAARASASTASTLISFSAFDAGVVVRALRAIGAVFRAAAGLDREQRRDLHLASDRNAARCMRCARNISSGNGRSNSARSRRASSRGGCCQAERRSGVRGARTWRGSCVQDSAGVLAHAAREVIPVERSAERAQTAQKQRPGGGRRAFVSGGAPLLARFRPSVHRNATCSSRFTALLLVRPTREPRASSHKRRGVWTNQTPHQSLASSLSDLTQK